MGETSVLGAVIAALFFGAGSGGATWSQQPVTTDGIGNQQSFRGWNVVSIYDTQWQAADDFWNVDTAPVSGINWSGSYVSWRETTPPPVSPTSFWFGIYDDSPGDEPGNLLWSYSTSSFTQQFVGYDGLDHGVLDAVFSYSIDLAPGDWFTPTGPGTSNWLSIAAVYGGDVPPVYQWGWLTKPEVTGDTAVWLVGDPPDWVPLEWDGHGWDTSFELERPGPVIPEPSSLGLAAIATGLIGLFRVARYSRS